MVYQLCTFFICFSIVQLFFFNRIYNYRKGAMFIEYKADREYDIEINKFNDEIKSTYIKLKIKL